MILQRSVLLLASLFAIVSCGADEGTQIGAGIFIPADALALDIDGDGTMDCIDLNRDGACTDSDLTPADIAANCDSEPRAKDTDGDGCPDVVDIDCDNAVEIVLVSTCDALKGPNPNGKGKGPGDKDNGKQKNGGADETDDGEENEDEDTPEEP